MILKRDKKDLFEMPQEYFLAHCISADFALGAGIAKQFDSKYNMRYKLMKKYEYIYLDSNPSRYIGDVLLVDNVFNLITKNKCYHKPTYESLNKCLLQLRKIVNLNGIDKLAIPKIGCGLDKLEWVVVEKLIISAFNDTDIEIVVCTL